MGLIPFRILRANANPTPLGVALIRIAPGARHLAQAVGASRAALYVMGALLGVTLYHAAFGFTSAWRVFIADGCGDGLRAQMLMLAVGVALFFPALSAGALFGTPVAGLASPAGTSLIFGASIFGIGMQLGGGGASGTLYTARGVICSACRTTYTCRHATLPKATAPHSSTVATTSHGSGAVNVSTGNTSANSVKINFSAPTDPRRRRQNPIPAAISAPDQ